MADGDPVATLRHAECSEWAWMRSCDPQEVPRLQSGGAFYAPRRIRTAPSWMPFFTHLQLGLLCRDERVARVCEIFAASLQEPPLIQAQRGSLGRGSGAARWPGSGGPTSRFPWICGRAVAADSPPSGPRAAWFPPGPWLPAPGLLARARLRSGSRLPSVLLGCSPVAGARMARLPAGELA